MTRPLREGVAAVGKVQSVPGPPSVRKGSFSRYAAATDSFGRRTEDVAPDGADVRHQTTRGVA